MHHYIVFLRRIISSSIARRSSADYCRAADIKWHCM